MTYLHKDSACSKETKEILSNIMKFKKGDYLLKGTLPESEETVTETDEPEEASNPLGSQDEEVSSNGEEDIPLNPSVDFLGIEEYVPEKETHIQVIDCQHVYEKGQKKRNYMEFKFDYTGL